MALGEIKAIENKEHKFGETDHYNLVELRKGKSGKVKPYLFTDNDLKVGEKRAEVNPEDVKKKKQPWWMIFLD